MSKNEEGKKVEELKFKSKDDKPNYEQIYRNWSDKKNTQLQ